MLLMKIIIRYKYRIVEPKFDRVYRRANSNIILLHNNEIAYVPRSHSVLVGIDCLCEFSNLYANKKRTKIAFPENAILRLRENL